MPIDPNIALGYRPPPLAPLQIQTPLEGLAKVVSLRSLMQEGQLKDLQLQQAQQAMREKQSLADLFSRAYGTDAAPAGGAPPTGAATAPAPAPEDLGAEALQFPAAQFASAQAAQPATPASVPLASAQAITPAVMPAARPAFPTPAQILRAAPTTGMGVIKSLTEQQKAQLELHIKQMEDEKGRTGQMSALATGAIDDDSLQRNLATAASQGYISWDDARRYVALGFDHPTTKAWLRSTQMQAVGADKAQEMALALARDAREGKLFDVNYAKGVADQRQKEAEAAGQSIGDIQDKSQLPGWLAQQGPTVIQRYGGLLASDLPFDQIKQTIQMGGRAPTPGVDIPLPQPVQEQKVAISAAQGLGAAQAKDAFEQQKDEALRTAVKKDPRLWNTLTPEQQNRLRPDLAREGYTEFGLKLSDTELGKLDDFQKAINTTASLKQRISENKDLVGPISGQAAKLPYGGGVIDVEGRKKLQAEIDLARQTIGKALEGGVLRKEDEDKYRNILATITDQPEVAIAKLDQLNTMLQRDLGSYRERLGASGRQLPETSGAEARGQNKPAAAAVPPGVQSLLGGEANKPGTYTLRDGRKFRKNPDGSITAL